MRANGIRRYAKHRAVHSAIYRAWACRQQALLPELPFSSEPERDDILSGEPHSHSPSRVFATGDEPKSATQSSFRTCGNDRRREVAVDTSSFRVHPLPISNVAPVPHRSIYLSVTPHQQHKADVAPSMHPEEDDDGDLMDIQDPPGIATGLPTPFSAPPISASYPSASLGDLSAEAAAEAHSRAVSAAAARVAAAAAAARTAANTAVATSSRAGRSGDTAISGSGGGRSGVRGGEALEDADLEDAARQPLEERLEKEAIAPLQVNRGGEEGRGGGGGEEG